MCGRFALYSSFQSIKDYADLLNELGDYERNYNIAPGESIPVIYRNEMGNQITFRKWGLIPFWAKDEKIGYRLINSRAETISEKPSFKYAFQKRRCLIPANGFFEWKKPEKQPYFCRLKERDLFSFGGIWESWKSPAGKIVKTCSIITTEANSKMKKIHHRMPLILEKEDEYRWLTANSKNVLHKMLKPFDEGKMEIYPVSKEVNSPQNNYSDLITAL